MTTRRIRRVAARLAGETWGGRWEAVKPSYDDHPIFDSTLAADGLDECGHDWRTSFDIRVCRSCGAIRPSDPASTLPPVTRGLVRPKTGQLPQGHTRND